jgi:hypothetical protein
MEFHGSLAVRVVVNRHHGSCLYSSYYAQTDPISRTDQQGGGYIYFFIPFTPTTPGIAAGLSEFWKVVEVVFQLFWWLISIYSTIPSRTTSMTAARNPTRRLPTLTLSMHIFLARQQLGSSPKSTRMSIVPPSRCIYISRRFFQKQTSSPWLYGGAVA